MVYLITNNELIDCDQWQGKILEADLDDLFTWSDSITDIGVDTETGGPFDFINRIWMAQFGNKEHQFVLDWHSLTWEQKKEIEERILLNRTKLKIFQNGKFDIKFFWLEGLDISMDIWCTLNTEALINAGLTKKKGFYALDEIAYRYTNTKLDKSKRGLIGFTFDSIIYGAGDVEVLPEIKSKQSQIIANRNLNRVCKLENDCVFPLAEIEFNGIELDLSKLKDIRETATQMIKEVMTLLDEELYNDINLREKFISYEATLFNPKPQSTINWKSPKDKLRLLKYIAPSIEDTKKDTLQEYKGVHTIFELLLDFSALNAILDKFVFKLPNHINRTTGRIHPNIWQVLKTGRISMSNPNMQQISSRHPLGRKIRSAFVLPEGWKFVVCDYSQFELVVIANFSQDPFWMDILQNGRDLHGELAAIVFDIPIDTVRKPSGIKDGWSFRDIIKTINYMLAYGGGAYKLATTLSITEMAAQVIINKYFALVPGVRSFLDMIGAVAVKRGYSRTPQPYGRVRMYPQYKGNKSKKEAVRRAGMNHVPQGCNADVVKAALVKCYKNFKCNPDVKIVLQVHDELVLAAKQEVAQEVGLELQDIMINAARVVLKNVDVKCSLEVGDYWDH